MYLSIYIRMYVCIYQPFEVLLRWHALRIRRRPRHHLGYSRGLSYWFTETDVFFFSGLHGMSGSPDFWKDRRPPNIIIDSPRAKKETDEASAKTGTSSFKPAGLKPPEASKPSDVKLKMDDTTIKVCAHCTTIRSTMSVPHA